VADTIAEDGWQLRRFDLVEDAAKLFPWNRFIRTKPGYFAIQYVRPSSSSIEIIETALKTDPFAADLIYGLGVHYYAIGDHRHANQAFERFAEIAPNSPLGRQVRAALQSCCMSQPQNKDTTP
jgi:tetratricopeptide (TPR) repeat protein